MLSEDALKSQDQCEDDENKTIAMPYFDSFLTVLLVDSEITAWGLKMWLLIRIQ